MTDLLLGLDPVDTPIADYERFGIRSGAADLIVHPDADTAPRLAWRPGWRVCLATPSWPDGSPVRVRHPGGLATGARRRGDSATR